jgi:hypothetical protein
VVIRLSEDLAIAKREFFAALRRYQLTDRRDCRRTFGLLIKALHDYPEKFRLWQHVLNYCRLSGHRDLGPVFDELDEYMEKNPLAGRFVRASILKVLTWHIIASARVVDAPDALPRRRRKALRYLLAVLKLTRVEDRRDDASFYEKASEWAFRGAVGSVAVFLADPSAEAGIRSDMVLLVDKRKEELAAIDWAGSPEDWVVGTEHSLAVWSWWAESRLQPADAISPGVIWQLIADRLPVTETASWSFWKLYPADLPRIAQRALNAGSHRLRPEERGWLLETPAGPSQLRTARRAGTKPVMDLVEWVDWVEERSRIYEFDPRLGEWTCLEITRQIAGLVKRRSALRASVHPRNFLIPAKWVEPTDQLTWEGWHTIATSHHVSVVRTGLIRDARIVPAWVDSYFVWDADAIQGLALILLGLLRRSFRWPAVWNPAGQQRAWASLGKRLIGSAPCSSWTSSILEACVTPRARESLLMSLFIQNQFGEDDTTKDPPEIGTLTQLGDTLAQSQRILSRYQLSVQNHEPRQLVPIRLDQLSRSSWASVVEDESS